MIRLAMLVCVFLVTCGKSGQLEKDFFKLPLSERVERMRQYSLEDQYRIFRYGNDRIEPPDLSLATPIAERGAAAIPFLTKQLKSSDDDLAVRDILWVLWTMLRLKTYDVRQDREVMDLLERRIRGMKSQYWQGSARERLEQIRNVPELRSP